MQIAIFAFDARTDGLLISSLERKLALFQQRGAEVRIYLQSGSHVAPQFQTYVTIADPAEPDYEDWEYLVSSDLVIAEVDQFYDLLHWLPALAGKNPRIIVDFYDEIPERKTNATQRDFVSLGLLWCADAVIVHSFRARRKLEEATGLPDDRLIYLPLPPRETLCESSVHAKSDVFIVSSYQARLCFSVVEALATGVPVIAARAGPLPELVGDAGLTFRRGDDADCDRQVQRVLAIPKGNDLSPARERYRIAVVSIRFGTDFIGGAERSLLTIAEALDASGHDVEVFTTCTRSECRWKNELREGTARWNSILVHRFAVDKTDRMRHLKSVRLLEERPEKISGELEEEYLLHSLHSSRLLEALARRMGKMDAVIVGPYLFGLTHDVAKTFPEKTLLLPCFHREPLVRLQAWQRTYEAVAGILYHTPEEKEFAQAELGINHPNGVVIGTYVKMGETCEVLETSEVCETGSRYLVYCGRYSKHKELPRLIEYARRYAELYPGRFRFVFLGQGEVAVPKEEWAVDYGFVDTRRKEKALAAADALVLLSRKESLSLVTLEAWAHGVPVVVDQECDVLGGQLRRCGGGRSVGDFAGFAQALDDLWSRPATWREMGQRGKEYVRQEYGSSERFAARLIRAIAASKMPIRELMRQKGIDRAQAFARSWQQGFSELVDRLLHSPCIAYQEHHTVQPHIASVHAGSGCGDVFVPVSVTNHGTHLAASAGPGTFVLCSQIVDEDGLPQSRKQVTSLPAPVLPGRSVSAVLSMEIPASPGVYQVCLWMERAGCAVPARKPSTTVELEVSHHEASVTMLTPLLNRVNSSLMEVERSRQLPTEYADTEGNWLVRWKNWVRRKLVNPIKHFYVDVLSRQQSAVNREMLDSVRQLTDCCAALDHAAQEMQKRLHALQEATREKVLRD